ncbi:MAG TPA: LuxR C-terminal-related transcriptional regulator [Candidatus Nesterenkonia stercoripullorum]|uniref:LuxR C-terminal-related transcriptional regulator n=1 Tax=Candidatus Nesterenkonia stercoripullorum TaxID=2838701 RepID=A0A9D1UVF9_9MICC|nr:LuxR C-terminal-related transcriptional regulator [Candidatus Nesterenkonia stercoripullorum]
MIFAEEIGQAKTALRDGWSVRICGDRGSGRSQIAAEVAEALERTGDTVHRCSGEPSARDSPRHVLSQLVLDLGLDPQNPNLTSLIDQVCRSLTPDAVLLVDDTHQLDAVSRRALATIRARTGVRTILTDHTPRGSFSAAPPDESGGAGGSGEPEGSGGPSGSGALSGSGDLSGSDGRNGSRDAAPPSQILRESRLSSGLPLRWPEHVITTRPLDLPGAGALARDILGDPLSPGTLTRVLTKTGGLPRLIETLVGSARHRGLLELRDGAWSQVGYSMWNLDMAPVVDDLLVEEPPGVVQLLRALARDPSLTAGQLTGSYGAETLHYATERGFVRPSAVTGTPGLVVWPPIIAERFSPERIPALTVGTPSAKAPDWCGAPEELSSLATRFVETAVEATGRSLTAWLKEPSIENALAYYAAASGDPRQSEELERVLASTRTDGRPADAASFGLAYARAQWAAVQRHDVDAAYELLEQFARVHPPWRGSAEAVMALISVMTGRGVPADIDALKEPGEDPAGIRGVCAVLVLLAAGRVGEARAIADSFVPVSERPANWGRQALQFFEGDVRGSLESAGADLGLAEQTLDRALFMSSAYTSVMAQHFLGEYPGVQRSLDAMVLVGRPGLDYTAMYSAALTMQGLASLFSGGFDPRDSFLSESATLMPQPGPFLGMGTDAVQPMLVVNGPAAASDRLAAQTVRRRRDLGYHTAAAQTAASVLVHAYGTATSRELRNALRDGDIPVYASAAELTALIDGGASADRLGAFLRQRSSPDQASVLRSLLLSASRFSLSDGDDARSRDLEAVAQHALDPLISTAPRPPDIGTVSAGLSLTSREREVVLLAGTRSNRDVAERLGLSVRTVENHIARAASKTGIRNREDLFRLVESLR